jgi:enamine deaminase RidA (YjgF/YER057c/UK114 family)
MDMVILVYTLWRGDSEMTERTRVFTGSPWEPVVGYCRAIRVGNRVEVAGTTAMKDGEVIGVGSAYEQTKSIIKIIEEALHKVGANLSDVVRTRMFVTDISKWEEIGKAHGEFFKDIQPVATMVEVKALIDSRLLVEIEAEAIVSCE